MTATTAQFIADAPAPTADLPRAALVTPRGETIIAPAVVEKIASRAASEVDGVGGVVEAGLSRLLPWSVGSGPQPARAAADVRAETVSVDLTVNVLYPEPVAAITGRTSGFRSPRLPAIAGRSSTSCMPCPCCLISSAPTGR